MGDIIVVGIVAAFFSLALLLVYGCERIIGSDDEAAGTSTSQASPEAELAA